MSTLEESYKINDTVVVFEGTIDSPDQLRVFKTKDENIHYIINSDGRVLSSFQSDNEIEYYQE